MGWCRWSNFPRNRVRKLFREVSSGRIQGQVADHLSKPCGAMNRAILLVFFAACCVGCTYAFTSMMPAPQLRSPALSASGRPAPATSTTMQMESADRRSFLLAGVAALSSAVIPAPAKAEDEVSIYVGAGCYWHVQVCPQQPPTSICTALHPLPPHLLVRTPSRDF